MGAWGYEPEDNDTAADWIGVVMSKSKLPSLIQKGLKSKREEEVRAAAYLLEQVGHVWIYDIDVLEEHLALGVRSLDRVLQSEDWIQSWNDPGQVKRSIRRQIRKLKNRLKSMHETENTLRSLEGM